LRPVSKRKKDQQEGETQMSKEKFVPHKNVPGPARLDMELADTSGTVNADPLFMADRWRSSTM
jgi:hypothetical protein